MNVKIYYTEHEIQSLYESLHEKTTKITTKKVIEAIHIICKKLVNNNSMPSATTLVKLLGNQGILISTRTIYNRREGSNPYPILIDAWISFGAQKRSKITVPADIHNNLITDNDLKEISDPVLRHKVMIIFGQNESLKQQNNTLREIGRLPLISPDSNSQEGPQQLPAQQNKLDNYDIDVLNKFLTSSAAHGLEFDENGALISKKTIQRDRILSEYGLKSAIEKSITRELTAI